MIIPSIDIQRGETVQLVGGEKEALTAGDPRDWARRFGRVGLTAVVDLDAARGTGENREVIEPLLRLAPCTVGGGIRDLATARRWLDLGAEHVVIGTAATEDLLRELPRERVIVALDARDGEVLSHGWQRGTGRTVGQRMQELRELAGTFLVTVVEREGRLAGIDLELARELKAAAGGSGLILAGGVADADQVAVLDRLGIDAQVGMALYTGRFDEADAVAACLASERPDGLWPTVVCDESGRALGLVWSSRESLRRALETGRGVYHSRRRGLWEKGATSGAVQELRRIALDCDRDCLRFTVRQHGDGFCHQGTPTCFGPARGLAALEARLAARRESAPAGSYTRRLLDQPDLLAAKLREEADELARAEAPTDVVHEAADVLYFAMVALGRAGRSLADVEDELDRRRRRVTRRPGDAKPPREERA
ncbi:phosphoribosyl-ATP diphosphatase [bacterium]|nr:phosphoribosyl-ATP diphosphatase [bacterium]